MSTTITGLRLERLLSALAPRMAECGRSKSKGFFLLKKSICYFDHRDPVVTQLVVQSFFEIYYNYSLIAYFLKLHVSIKGENSINFIHFLIILCHGNTQLC